MPPALSSVPRHADIVRRLVLASRLPSRAEPALNPHSACCLAGAQLSATSCLGAFWTPATTARGRGRHAGVQKPAQIRRLLLSLHRSGSAEKHLISADAHLAY